MIDSQLPSNDTSGAQFDVVESASLSSSGPFDLSTNRPSTHPGKPNLASPWAIFDQEEPPRRSSLHEESDVVLEVVIIWGNSVLSVSHLSPPRSFTLGEQASCDSAQSLKCKVDFLLPREALGFDELTLVGVQGSSVFLNLPTNATGYLKERGRQTSLGEQLVIDEKSSGLASTKSEKLSVGMCAKVRVNEIDFHISLVKKAAPIKRGFGANWDPAPSKYFLFTLVTMGSLAASLAYFVPPLGLTDEGSLKKERFLVISQYLDAASERERKKEVESGESSQAQDEGAAAQQAAAPAGQVGKKEAPTDKKRLAVRGPRDNVQLQLARKAAIFEASTFGMIAMLAGDVHAPTSVFGGDFTLGSHDVSAHGVLWGDALGESNGMGGLSLAGTGSGGGALYGRGLGVGVGGVGTIGSGLGKSGFGRSGNLGSGGHQTRVPRLKMGHTEVSGHLPRQTIQRIVRQNFGRFRLCYEQGLAKAPNLEGRIPVRFVIGRDGAVSSVSSSGGFPDSSVRSCVQSAFYGISFPPPSSGVVQVTYPLMFSPSS